MHIMTRSNNSAGSCGKTYVVLILIAAVLLIALIGARYFYHGRAPEDARKRVCAQNLRNLAFLCKTYAEDNSSIYPSKLSFLYPDYAPDLFIFVCPNDDMQPNMISSDDIDIRSSYVLVEQASGSSRSNQVLLYEKIGRHYDGCHVAYRNGHVEFLTEDAFAELLNSLGDRQESE